MGTGMGVEAGTGTGGFKVVRLNGRTMPVTDEEREELGKIGARIVPVEGDDPEEIAGEMKDADAVIVIATKLRAPLIRRFEKCRIISRAGTGVDNIDVETATELGIIVTNVPDFCINEMADHTMAFILAMSRQLPLMDRLTREGAWHELRTTGGGFRRLAGQKLGLVGFGNVARAVAARARPFGLDVVAYHYKHTPGTVVDGVPMVDLDRLLAESDFVSLHVPLTEKTRHMIGERALRMMKPTAVLINTSRGGVVDEDALAQALAEGRIAGAATDVYGCVDVFDPAYRGRPDHPLFSRENTLFTPHVGAYSEEAKQEVRRKSARHVADVLSGRRPPNIVNPAALARYRFELR